MATQPTIFDAEPGTSADTVDIPQTAGADELDLTKLWPGAFEVPLVSGGSPVIRAQMNKFMQVLLQNIYFMQVGGVYLYQADKDYTIGTRVLFNGDFYRCIQANGPGSTVANPTNSTYWDKFVCASELETTPAGVIVPYGGVTVPSGYLACNGAEVSRTGKARLFSAIGTKWGEGDGVTTFNVPNLNNDSFLKGVTASAVGNSYSATLPAMTASSAGAHTHTRGTMNITGDFSTTDCGEIEVPTGALYHGGTKGDYTMSGFGGGVPAHDYLVKFNAARTWSGSTSSNGAHTHTVSNLNGVETGTTVQPKNSGVMFIIKD